MKSIFLSFACLLLGHQLFASHAEGAQIKYAFNGSSYTVSVEQYRRCGGTPFPASVAVTLSSASLSSSVVVSLPLVQTDTVDYSCPYNTNSCTTPGSTQPGKVIVNYQDNVSIPPASDWVISFIESARTSSGNLPMDNLYVEARLNNSIGVNSNPVWPVKENYYLNAGTAFSYPLQLVDADGDSLALSLIHPQNGPGSAVVPFIGFTLSSPFGPGSSCSINNTTNTLDMMGTNPGWYTLAIRVDEYRGTTKIGSYIRDFIVAISPAGAHDFTFPTPASGSNFEGRVCPGQTGIITVNFDDISTDSVYVDLTAPSLSGWSFSASSTDGLGMGIASITYTAPVTMNPATTDPIMIPVYVVDDACPHSQIEYTLIIRPASCIVDSVWPGDANSDNVVNLFDPLYVALAYSQTGPARPGATTAWTGQYCADWATSFPLSGVNHKHADCDGDGVVNVSDLTPIISNYGLMHPRPAERTNSGAPLKFDLTGIVFTPGAAVSIPIVLGDAMNDVDNLFGMATRVSVSGIILDNAPVINNTTTWMGTASNLFNFNKQIGKNTIDWVQAHTDGMASATGQGVIGTLEFTVPANATIGSTLNLNFSSTLLINIDGAEIPEFTEEQATATIQWPTTVANVNESTLNATVVPNPSSSDAKLHFVMQQKGNVTVDITDVTGKRVWHYVQSFENGSQAISLPAANLSSGLYLIQMSCNEQKLGQLKWNKL